ncbi:MAG: GEVED domain-containing protein [Bacteroidota bacterium]
MNTTFIKPMSRHFSLTKKLLCAGALLLSSLTDASAQLIKIGTGTTGNSATQYPTPFGNDNLGQKAQYLYRASELVAAGMKPGWIDSIGFNVLDVTGTYLHTNFKIYIGPGTGTIGSGVTTPPPPAAGTLTTTALTWQTGLNLVVYDPVIAYFPVLGMNYFKFSSPFYWNGYDNIVIGTCFWSGISSANASVEWTTGLGFNGSRTYVPTSSTMGISICDYTGVSTTGTVTSRPNAYFNNKFDTCSSAPSAGTAFATLPSPPDFCLYDDSLLLGLSGVSLSNGLSFQWQWSLTPTGPWTNLGAASTTTVNKKAYQTVSTYYRCIVTCVAKALSGTSTTVYVPQSAPYKCDCASAASDNTKEDILSVGLAGLYNLSPCSISAGLYEDYTSGALKLPPAELEPGTGYSVTMRLGACDGVARNRAVKVFIDYNQDGKYDIINPAGEKEMVYANTYSAAQPVPQTAIGDFTVPTTALKGLTAMRIVYASASALSDINSCGTYPDGETHDYPIKILNFGKPTVTGRLIVCEHDSVVMNVFSVADTPVVFSWTGPGGFTGIGPKITFVDAAPSLTGTYYVTATSGGRTSSPQAVEVIVYPKPPVPNVLNANMCQYEPDGKLRTDGKNVIWYNVPVGGFGDTNAPVLPTHTPNTATFYLTQTVNGCVSDRGKVVVNVLLKPGPPVVKSPVTYCQLQVPDLAAKGVDLKWYLDSAGGVASTISPIPPTGFPDTMDYYVTQTINGCESDRVRVRVIVYEQPNGIILHTKPNVCQYDTASFTYFGNAPSTYEYKWFTTDATFISGGGQGPVVFQFNEFGDKIVSLYVNNGKCATSKINDTITVRRAPTADIDSVYNACINVPVTVTIDTATPNIENYVWNWDGGKLVNETINGGPYGVYWSTPGTKILGLVVYHRGCPSLMINQEVIVRDRPFAKILSKSKVTNYGQDTSVLIGKICSRDTVVFTAFRDSTYKYKWYPEYYFDIDTTHIASDRMNAPAFVRVDVESMYGCKSSDSVFVNAEACCEMAFPNAFTPNGDKRNDLFRPIRDGRQDIVTFRIMNRWGQTVFESGSTDTEGWDGTFAGKAQDMGVYQYYVKYKCLDGLFYELKGDVTLIR